MKLFLIIIGLYISNLSIGQIIFDFHDPDLFKLKKITEVKIYSIDPLTNIPDLAGFITKYDSINHVVIESFYNHKGRIKKKDNQFFTKDKYGFIRTIKSIKDTVSYSQYQTFSNENIIRIFQSWIFYNNEKLIIKDSTLQSIARGSISKYRLTNYSYNEKNELVKIVTVWPNPYDSIWDEYQTIIIDRTPEKGCFKISVNGYPGPIVAAPGSFIIECNSYGLPSKIYRYDKNDQLIITSIYEYK